MDKTLKCRDLGMDCEFVARGKTDEEILKKAAEHAKNKHNMKTIPNDVMVKARKAIRTA